MKFKEERRNAGSGKREAGKGKGKGESKHSGVDSFPSERYFGRLLITQRKRIKTPRNGSNINAQVLYAWSGDGIGKSLSAGGSGWRGGFKSGLMYPCTHVPSGKGDNPPRHF